MIQDLSLEQENLQFKEKFNEFAEGLNLNPFNKIYSQIVNNQNYLKELNFDPKKRIESIVEFATRRKTIKKEYLNNQLISHINKVEGFLKLNQEDKKIFLVETKIKTKEKDYIEHIFFTENLLLNKMMQNSLNCAPLSDDSLNNYKLP